MIKRKGKVRKLTHLWNPYLIPLYIRYNILCAYTLQIFITKQLKYIIHIYYNILCIFKKEQQIYRDAEDKKQRR